MANPSRSSKRAILAWLALLGCAISAWLGAYQLGVAALPPDPFFDGTAAVLHSRVSAALPVPDAVLGAVAYAVELALTVLGGADRYRTRPWLVIAYGATAVSMALTSALLVVLQATVEHAWCTLCLASAALSFLIVGPAIAEAAAAVRFVAREVRHGRPIAAALRGPSPA